MPSARAPDASSAPSATESVTPPPTAAPPAGAPLIGAPLTAAPLTAAPAAAFGGLRLIAVPGGWPPYDCEVHGAGCPAAAEISVAGPCADLDPEADGSRLGVIGYASTPCENCRFYAARLLLSQHVAPAWLIEECRYDSAEDCRALAGTPTGSTEEG